jgi:hypothetical protein
MIDEPNTPAPVDPPSPDDAPAPSNPFADLQAELEGIGLDTVGQPGAPLPPSGVPSGIQPQATHHISPVASPPASSVAVAAAQPGPVVAPSKLKLCPGCNAVREFVDGRCLNCGYQPDADTLHGAEAAFEIGEAYGSQRSPLFWIVLTVVAVGLLALAGWFAYPILFKPERTTSDASTNVDAAVAQQEAEAEAAVALKAVTVDDALKTQITSAFRAGNKAWADVGTKAYVYRYAVREYNEAMKSQTLTVIGYTAGKEAALATVDKAAPMTKVFEGLLGDLASNAGVTATLELETGDSESAGIGDVYVVYGTDYGRDHLEEMQPIIDTIENYRKSEGQYPLALDGTVISLRTKGNPQYMPGGYGYIPIFKTDGSGNVIMGTGAGVKRLKPAEINGYYLIKFLSQATEGLDFYSQADLNYYTQKISPFPYQPQGKVRNMPLTKDGKPDGVACVVKNGKLL